MIGTTTMIIYKAGNGWRGKLLSSFYTSFWIVLLVSRPDTFIRFWQASGWIWRACMAFALATFPLVPLESFISRTVFTDTLIEHRSMFGMKLTRAYSDVTKLFQDTYFLKIQFEDGKKMKIWSSKGDLGKIVSIIQKHAGKPVPVEAAF
jgi:hypothetical protein